MTVCYHPYAMIEVIKSLSITSSLQCQLAPNINTMECVHLASSRCKQESEIYRLITEVTTTLSLFGTQHRTLVYEYCDFIPFSLASSLHSSTHFTKRGLGQPLGLLLRRVPASRSTRPAMLLQCNIVHHGLMQIVD